VPTSRNRRGRPGRSRPVGGRACSARPAQAAFPGANGKIAFQSACDGNFEVYVMNADGSGPTNLTGNAAFDGVPS